MVTILTRAGKIVRDAGKAQRIPAGKTAADCRCCGPPPCIQLCGESGELIGWDIEVSGLLSQYVMYSILGSFSTENWKVTTEGLDGLNGVYQLRGIVDGECDPAREGFATTPVTMRSQRVNPSGDTCPQTSCPTTGTEYSCNVSGEIGFNAQGAFMDVAGIAANCPTSFAAFISITGVFNFSANYCETSAISVFIGNTCRDPMTGQPIPGGSLVCPGSTAGGFVTVTRTPVFA